MTDNGPTPEIVNRLHLLRIRNGLTIQKMAELCAIPKSSLESYMKLSGPKRPGLDALMAIADGMDVSIDWLVGRTEDSFSPKLTQREYAIACFNAALRLLRTLRAAEASSTGPLFVEDLVAGRPENLLAADAMLDFIDAIKLYHRTGPSPDRQRIASIILDEFSKATGN